MIARKPARPAHDIRHWRSCVHCGFLGDDRRMIAVKADHYHDACAVVTFTTAQILEMPIDELNKFTLYATGANLMKKIMKRAAL